jgi:hypothetical protein
MATTYHYQLISIIISLFGTRQRLHGGCGVECVVGDGNDRRHCAYAHNQIQGTVQQIMTCTFSNHFSLVKTHGSFHGECICIGST